MNLNAGLQRFLALTGKGEERVAAVFATNQDDASMAVRYLCRESPRLPIFLFGLMPAPPDCVRLCAAVLVCPDPGELLVEAQKLLWRYRVAFIVAPWTRTPGGWVLKWGAFLIPPFRVLVMNEHGGFFLPSPGNVARHLYRRFHDVANALGPTVRDRWQAIRFLGFLSLAITYPAFARRAFGWLEPDCDLNLPPVQAEGTDIAEYRYAMKQWDYELLMGVINNPRVRFIHFVQGATRSGAGDLLPLFEDRRTFAVTRQTEHRGWQKMMLFRAPFRRLEPGSATRTMAPIGRSMLVDRAKLAAIGMPRTLVPYTAWFLVFWKAAAAGWRSYTAGAAGRTTLCPDWPYEEGEFVSRLRFDPGMNVRGPRDADLSRGNIVFPVGGAKPFRGLPRVLVVSPYLPYPLSHGGAVRIYNLCRALAARIDFVLVCFKEKDDVAEYGKLLEVFRDVRVIDTDEPAGTDRSLPEQVRLHPSASMHAAIGELCRSLSIDILQVEYTHMARFGTAAGRTPTILVEHDLTFSLYRQLAEQRPSNSSWAEYHRWLRFEKEALARNDAVWVMSDDDRVKAIEAGSRPGSTFVVPNGVDTSHFHAPPAPCGPPEVFYAGSFRHLPNILGFERLRREVMPRVWQRFPDTRLRVVAGPEPARYWRELTGRDYPERFDPRIEIHPFVADLRPLYARASVVAVPLAVSAGTNIKVMEAMACRKAVVTTPVGCYGLDLKDNHDALIREDWTAFAGAMIRLLDDAALRETIACHARQSVEARFDWRAVATRALASYGALLSGHVRGTIARSGHSGTQAGVSE